MFGNRTNNKLEGVLESTPEVGQVERQKLRTCCHCQFTWVETKGSGALRGFCQRCMGFVCGPVCAGACVHWEQRLENLEAGRPADWAPIMASVPDAVPRG